MSFVAETADGGSMGSVSSMSDTAHEGHSSSRTSASSHQDCDLGEGSESESYVEVEHLGEDAMPGTAAFGTTLAGGATSPPPCNVVRHVTKRTLITLHQRSVLEEYYRNGMTSASQQLTEVHEQVTEKTGLDLAVVRNWIRNRRRPNAAKMAEKMAEKIAAYGIPVTSSLPTTQLPTLIPSNPSLTPLSTLPHTVVVTATNHHHMAPGIIRVTEPTSGSPGSLPFCTLPQITTPEPKRICLEQNNHHHNSSLSPLTSSSLLVKVRVCGSGECDFVEVEVHPLTYSALLTACCEELEVPSSDIVKIRKLPNVLVRKDRDIQRMTDGQELEVLLKTESTSGSSVTAAVSPLATYPTTSMLTVNPFTASNAAMLALSNQGMVHRNSDGLVAMKPDENGTGNHISGLTSDSSEVQNHTHPATTINGIQ